MVRLYKTDYVLVDKNNKPTQDLWLIYGNVDEVKEDSKLTGSNYIPMTKLSKYWKNKYKKYIRRNIDTIGNIKEAKEYLKTKYNNEK
jgi:hypothetical protein